jgi:hypothetical protein
VRIRYIVQLHEGVYLATRHGDITRDWREAQFFNTVLGASTARNKYLPSSRRGGSVIYGVDLDTGERFDYFERRREV